VGWAIETSFNLTALRAGLCCDFGVYSPANIALSSDSARPLKRLPCPICRAGQLNLILSPWASNPVTRQEVHSCQSPALRMCPQMAGEDIMKHNSDYSGAAFSQCTKTIRRFTAVNSSFTLAPGPLRPLAAYGQKVASSAFRGLNRLHAKWVTRSGRYVSTDPAVFRSKL